MYLLPEDFIGYYKISGNTYSEIELQTYIDNIEPKVLRSLLGCELYDLFVADLDGNGVPQTQIYLDIYNAFYTDYNNCQIKSDGMLEMLKGFIYYEYVRDGNFFNTISGTVKNTFVNSEMARTAEFGLNERYNVALQSFDAIQWFICQNEENYPTYNGVKLDVQIWL